MAKTSLCHTASDVDKEKFVLVFFSLQERYCFTQHLHRLSEAALHQENTAQHRSRQRGKLRILQLRS